MACDRGLLFWPPCIHGARPSPAGTAFQGPLYALRGKKGNRNGGNGKERGMMAFVTVFLTTRTKYTFSSISFGKNNFNVEQKQDGHVKYKDYIPSIHWHQQITKRRQA